MVERRSLVEGIAGTAAPEEEKQFVYGGETPKSSSPATNTPLDASPASPDRLLPQMASRVPITTRARPDLAMALKRASLERQLSGETPYFVQDILEEALSAWLKARGYLR